MYNINIVIYEPYGNLKPKIYNTKKREKGIHANTKEATNQKERKQKKKVTNNSKTTRK